MIYVSYCLKNVLLHLVSHVSFLDQFLFIGWNTSSRILSERFVALNSWLQNVVIWQLCLNSYLLLHNKLWLNLVAYNNTYFSQFLWVGNLGEILMVASGSVTQEAVMKLPAWTVVTSKDLTKERIQFQAQWCGCWQNSGPWRLLDGGLLSFLDKCSFP